MQKKSFTLNKEQIIQEFNQRKPLFEELQTTAKFILKKNLDKTEIKIHSLPSRVKEADSFCGKVERFQIENPFESIKDIVGLRVICLFLSDISKIGEIIRQHFTVIFEDNKVDDSKLASFGYLSVHFIVKLGDDYKKTVYSDIKDLAFEIQVRTIAMDAWANISHYLDYKTDQDIPKELKKDFYALSGMFYVADKHFQLFFEQRAEKQEQISDVFEKGNEEDIFSQPLNLDTLTAYLKSKFPDRKTAGPEHISHLVNELPDAGYETIGAVDKLVDNGLEAFDYYENDNTPNGGNFYDVGVVRIIAQISDEKYRRRIAEKTAIVYKKEVDEWIENQNKRFQPYEKYIKKS